MVKLITVIGATGIQGGSVVEILRHRDDFAVRGITRNKTSAGAKALALKGVQMVEADLDDLSSLKTAFEGSYAIFAVTNFFEHLMQHGEAEAVEREAKQGINLAKAALATSTLEHYIWSSLPNARQISNGQISLGHYEGKTRVADFIKANTILLQKTTFLWITCYASDIQYPFYKPFQIPTVGSDHFIQLSATSAAVPIKLVGDATVNVGLFVKSILEQPEKTLPGRTVLAVTDDMTAGEWLSSWAAVHGKKAQHIQIDKAAYYNLWPVFAELMDRNQMYWELAGEKSFSGEDVILTKEDLQITGLVNTATAMAKMDI